MTPSKAAWAARDRERYFADPEYQAYRRRLARESYRRLKDVKAARKKFRYENDPDYRAAVLERARTRERNKSVRSLKYARKKARLSGARVTRVDVRLVLLRSGGWCGICCQPLGDGKIHFDHIVPLAKGGPHAKDNLQATHARCNMSKGARVEA